MKDRSIDPTLKMQQMWEQILDMLDNQELATIIEFVHNEIVRVKESEAFSAGLDGRRFMANFSRGGKNE